MVMIIGTYLAYVHGECDLLKNDKINRKNIKRAFTAVPEPKDQSETFCPSILYTHIRS